MGESVIVYIGKRLEKLESDPLFNIDPIRMPQERPDKRRLTAARYKRITELGFFDEMTNFHNPAGSQAMNQVLTQLDMGLAVKRAMSQEVRRVRLGVSSTKL